MNANSTRFWKTPLEPIQPAAPDLSYYLSDHIEKLRDVSAQALNKIMNAKSEVTHPKDLYSLARILNEIYNKPKEAITLLWKARKSPEATIAPEEYLDELYQSLRGLSLDDVERIIVETVDPQYHELAHLNRPFLDIVILEHGSFDWEYEPGFHDADWDGEGPNDLPPSLRIFPPTKRTKT